MNQSFKARAPPARLDLPKTKTDKSAKFFCSRKAGNNVNNSLNVGFKASQAHQNGSRIQAMIRQNATVHEQRKAVTKLEQKHGLKAVWYGVEFR